MRFLWSLASIVILSSFAPEAGTTLFAGRDELLEQLASRKEDLARTERRIDELERDTSNAQVALSRMRLDASQTLEELSGRASLMYRVSRRGGAFRYLLTADSITEMLGRLTILKKLISDELFLLRDQNRRVAELDDRVSTNADEMNQAREMQSLLSNTIGELKRQLAGI